MVFHDFGCFLLTTQSSFDDLSRRLAERGVTEPVTLEHFRPTITISGRSPPFDEVNNYEILVEKSVCETSVSNYSGIARH